jgi:hypothetical protein
MEDVEPFCQFWTTAGDWKVGRSSVKYGACCQQRTHPPIHPLQSTCCTSTTQTHRQAWLHGPLSALDAEGVEKEVTAAGKSLTKLGKVKGVGSTDQLTGMASVFAAVLHLCPATLSHFEDGD